jgi:DUF4097 and DUF4098 domain-containing protein YvlB
MRTWMTVAVAAALALANGAAGRAQTDFQWHGAVRSGGSLEVKGINGDVRARASSSGEAEVVAVKSARRSDPASVRIELVPHAGGITICAVYPDVPGRDPNRCEPGPNSKSNTRDNDTTVRFEVHVPVGVNFVGHTVNGDVAADSLNGDVDARTVNGSVRVSATGNVVANTVNGSLDVTAGRADWPAGAKFSTVNGAITLRLPAYLSAALHASTVNGEISSDFPITVGQMSRRRLDGTIGGGGQPLDLSTVNGSITLLKQ